MIHSTSCLSEADQILSKTIIDVILLDHELGDGEKGIDYLQTIRKNSATVQVIMVTKHCEMEYVVDAIKKSAFYYLSKPVNSDELLSLTEKAVNLS